MTISRDTADRAIKAWSQVKEGKKPTIKWDHKTEAGEDALVLCEGEKLLHLYVEEEIIHVLYLDTRYMYNIVDVRDYSFTSSDSVYATDSDGNPVEINYPVKCYDNRLHIILNDESELSFKIVGNQKRPRSKATKQNPDGGL